MMKRIAYFSQVLLAMIFLTCLTAVAEDRLNVVATNFPCYDFARQVCGDGAEVTMLLKPGTEAHAYDPTPADIIAIGDADLFVYIGGESDTWADGILASFDEGDRPAALRMMDCVSDLVEEDDADAGHHGAVPEYDEHIWTSPVNAAAMVRALGEVLASLEGADADACREAASAYAAQIEQIDGALRQLVEGAISSIRLPLPRMGPCGKGVAARPREGLLQAPLSACRLEVAHAGEHAVFASEQLGGGALFDDLALR